MDKMNEAIVDEGDEMEKEFAISKPVEQKHVEKGLDMLMLPRKEKKIKVEEVKLLGNDDY
jgi:hypothetical protein